MSRGPWHVAVLMGGWSAEREVSLMSGKGIADAGSLQAAFNMALAMSQAAG